MLCEAAWGAAHTKNCYLASKYFKLKARRGSQRALVSIARKILLAAYHILRTGQSYRELGGEYLDRLHFDRRRLNLVRALQTLGYTVALTPNSDSPNA
jgi:hypothetical protein